MSEAPEPAAQRPRTPREEWTLPIVLLALTFASTMFVGAGWVDGNPSGSPLSTSGLLRGWVFAVPLMAILMAHEFGHYIAGRRHGVDISPPYFIPIPVMLGTFGAIIRMRGPIKTRNALLDVGAAGPLAGLAVALPVLIYGISVSPIAALPERGDVPFLIEGRSVLYLSLLYAIKGPIPDGYDIFLGPTALAGWAGLLVTMINLVPVGQLDGGHIAYALLGPPQNRMSERVRRALPAVALLVGLAYGIPSYLAGTRGELLVQDFLAGMHWLIWAGLLWLMTRMAGPKHPPTGPEPLSPRRRTVALATLLLFVLLFMPAWVRSH